MTVEATVNTYARETPRKTLPGIYVGFYGLTHELQPPIEPGVDIIALYDIHGDLITRGVYQGYSIPYNKDIGEYSIEEIIESEGVVKCSGEPRNIPVVPMRVEKIGKIYDCGKSNERIIME